MVYCVFSSPSFALTSLSCQQIGKYARSSSLIETDGWFWVRTRGDHRQFHHGLPHPQGERRQRIRGTPIGMINRGHRSKATQQPR